MNDTKSNYIISQKSNSYLRTIPYLYIWLSFLLGSHFCIVNDMEDVSVSALGYPGFLIYEQFCDIVDPEDS